MTGLNFPNAVSDEKDFYGREYGLRQIEETFLAGQRVPVLVIGERRTGKTSLMNVAVRRLQAMAEETGGLCYAFLPVEPRGITTFTAFARAILMRLRTYLWNVSPAVMDDESDADNEIETIEQFEIQFTHLLQYSTREIFLVCIDEFDEIVRKTQRPELSRILGLINDADKARLPLAFFFTMTSVPATMREEIPSALISMSQLLELRPLTAGEVIELIDGVCGGHLEWKEDSLARFMRICGGHPYFTKLVLAHLLPQCMSSGERAVSAEMLDEAVSEALCDTRTDYVFENLYEEYFSDQEKEILLQLARRQAPLPGKELSSVNPSWVTVARRLVKRNYLVEGADGFNFYAAFMSLWLRGWAAFEEQCAKYTNLQEKLSVPKEIIVDVTAGQVSVLGIPVKLSAQEFAIMNYLAERSGQLVHREELINQIWGTEEGVSDQVVDTAFYRLRKKIGDQQAQYIETVPGQGFKLHRTVRVTNQERRNSAS